MIKIDTILYRKAAFYNSLLKYKVIGFENDNIVVECLSCRHYDDNCKVLIGKVSRFSFEEDAYDFIRMLNNEHEEYEHTTRSYDRGESPYFVDIKKAKKWLYERLIIKYENELAYYEKVSSSTSTINKTKDKILGFKYELDAIKKTY